MLTVHRHVEKQHASNANCCAASAGSACVLSVCSNSEAQAVVAGPIDIRRLKVEMVNKISLSGSGSETPDGARTSESRSPAKDGQGGQGSQGRAAPYEMVEVEKASDTKMGNDNEHDDAPRPPHIQCCYCGKYVRNVGESLAQHQLSDGCRARQQRAEDWERAKARLADRRAAPWSKPAAPAAAKPNTNAKPVVLQLRSRQASERRRSRSRRRSRRRSSRRRSPARSLPSCRSSTARRMVASSCGRSGRGDRRGIARSPLPRTRPRSRPRRFCCRSTRRLPRPRPPQPPRLECDRDRDSRSRARGRKGSKRAGSSPRRQRSCHFTLNLNM